MIINPVTFIIMNLSMFINRYCYFCLLVWVCISCQSVSKDIIEKLSQKPQLFPDYTDIVIPYNIAPLNFKVTGRPERVEAVLRFSDESWVLTGEEKIIFPEKKWKQWLEKAKGGHISVTLKAEWDGKTYQYVPFDWEVSIAPIDPVLVYRKIEPGYTTTNTMSINQRNLTNFNDEVLIDNMKSETGCINCHSFCQNDPDQMLFHSRQKNPGTYFIRHGEIEKVNTQAGEMSQAAGYPFWHPSGNYIAFSVSQTRQIFYEGKTPIEVFDLGADVIVYDLKDKKSYTIPELFADSLHNNYPVFTPDGRTLIYCGGKAVQVPEYKSDLKLSLCAIRFDADKMEFGETVDTLVSASRINKSMLHPRVSPCGRFLLYTEVEYGSFSNYHKSSDLALYDLKNKTHRTLDEINSEDVDSFHSWSSVGGWVVFSSRRNDGYYTYPWFTQINDAGKASKPFLLPQENPDFYIYCLTSYNVPELVKGKVNINPYNLRKAVMEAPVIKSKYEIQND